MVHQLSEGPNPTSQEPDLDTIRQQDVTDALQYLDAVRDEFYAQPGVYNAFLDIMKECKVQKLETQGAITRVSQLFAGRPQLLQGFSEFLPYNYHMDMTPVAPACISHVLQDASAHGPQPGRANTQLDVGGALLYVEAFKCSVGLRSETYSLFVEVMDQASVGHIDVPTATERVSQLFTNYPELLNGLVPFLPVGPPLEVPVDHGSHAAAVEH